MDVLEGIAKAILMLGFVFLVIALVAALFMVVFNIATGIDERLQD